jgi:arabinan endo-1,5-alpha-L-arabinosidase
MRRILFALVFCAMLAQLHACAAEGSFPAFTPLGDPGRMADQKRWGELNTHDPSIVKDGDKYYVFSTDASYGDVHKPGIQVRVSSDLIAWDYAGTAFDDFERDCADVIAYAKLDPAKKQGLWAPDVVKEGLVYRMYLSASTFGSSRSCIALAEARRPEGPYVYKGIVLHSYANALNGANAIDPAIVTDAEGNQWISYGSFFGGIFLQRLD